jgi:arylsulfatase
VLDAKAAPAFAWDFTVCVDGSATASFDAAPMLLGFAPFQGIDVGIDRRSPVVWNLYEKHGAFAYSGTLMSVTYRPGRAAPYDPNHMVAAMQAAGRAGQ